MLRWKDEIVVEVSFADRNVLSLTVGGNPASLFEVVQANS